MNDILPAQMPQWHHVEATARRIFRLYGFSELRTPLVEKTELFQRGMGQDTDVVEKQMYTFTDKAGASVTLRPEATASVMRCVIEHGLLGREPVLKLYSIGPMFRYERPQKGRYRQFHQLNVERLGEEGPLSDAETLSLAYELALACGLTGVQLEVNSLGCAACRGGFTQALRDFLAARESLLCGDCRRRMQTNPLRVLDCKVEGCQAAASGAPVIGDYLCTGCREHFEGLLQGLRVMQVPFTPNPRLVRGLDYYMRTTFELTASGLGSQNAVAGGGRYDGLLAALGGTDVPGIGFAFGLERLVMLLGERESAREGCFVAVHGAGHVQEQALALMSELRRGGVPVEAALEKSFKAQMKNAGRSGYPVCLILGEDEVASGTLTVKDLRDATQVSIAREGAAGTLTDMFAWQGEMA